MTAIRPCLRQTTALTHETEHYLKSPVVHTRETSQLRVRQVIRRMRGISQSYLVETEDRASYVVKLFNNPEGNRSLVNEYIGSKMYKQLGISTPNTKLLEIDPDNLIVSDDSYFRYAHDNRSLRTGIHFGSSCPANPKVTTMFDFVPGKLLKRVNNISDFASAFVIDRLLGLADSRQAVFVSRPEIRSEGKKCALTAFFIDHGRLFGGGKWETADQFVNGLYRDHVVYSDISERSWDEAIESVSSLPGWCLPEYISEIPEMWLSPADRAELDRDVMMVKYRQKSLKRLVAQHRAALRPSVLLKPCCVG